MSGHQITELSSSGDWNSAGWSPVATLLRGARPDRGEVHAGSRHLATYSGGTGGTTYLILSDWLGTERVRTTSNGTNCETIVSQPFGDAQAISGSCGDPSPMHFTGQQRDTESGLDDFKARYNSSQFGRFMSPDPEILAGTLHRGDPQGWNAYGYVRNSPLVLTDPDGENYTVCDTDGKNCSDLTDAQYKQWLNSSPNIRQSPSGTLYAVNDNGTSTKVGTATYYNEKDIAALQYLNRQINPVIQFLFYATGVVTGGVYAVTAYGTYQAGTLALGASSAAAGTAPFAADSPQLQRFIDMMYQASDALPGGTAGALRHEIETGELLSPAGHGIKAQELINGLTKLIQQGNLSPTDTVKAQALINELRAAQNTRP